MRIATVVLVLTMLCHVPSASAQTPGPHVGVKFGPTFANVSVDPEDPDEETGTRWGIGGGGFAVLPLNPRIAVQIEALFTPKGASSEGAAGTEFEGFESKLALDYLEFPVLIRLEGPRSPDRGFHVFGGGALGFNTSARSELTIDGELFDNGVSDNIRDEINAFEFSVVVGAGMEFGRYLVVDARYSLGLTNVNDIEDDDTTVKNRAFTILAGVRFGRR